MYSELHKYGYELDSKSLIWIKDGFQGISYNDGNEAETRIASIIEESDDLSTLSPQLRSHCTDWPSLYHLGSARSNLLRPFYEKLKGSSVLEIGAGCGAITRYLGESGANVLALEGSPRRAGITRSRTRDLNNVTVVADRFDQFKSRMHFDIITLIGVFEYADLFTAGVNPSRSMLQQAQSMLKPDGRLIIAIENQLGLKYFAGSPEDHLNEPMYGIENRYQTDQPQTFGRRVLLEMLQKAGFLAVEFLAPLPDYKFPVSITTEHGFACKEFDAGVLGGQSVVRDSQLPMHPSFSPERAWPVLCDNYIALDLANSFLIVASQGDNRCLDGDMLAYYYNTNRAEPFCKETRFILKGANKIEVISLPLGRKPSRHRKGDVINFTLVEKDDYTIGTPLYEQLQDIVIREGWKLEELAGFLRNYLEIVSAYISKRGAGVEIDSRETLLPGYCFDLTPQNIIVNPAGQWSVFDQEWTLNKSMPVGWLIFRSMLPVLHSISRFGQPSDVSVGTQLELILAVFKALDFPTDEKTIDSYVKMESSVQVEVLSNSTDNINFNKNAQLVFRSTLDSLQHEIGGLKFMVEERDRKLKLLISSTSWRITRPLRALKRLVRR